MAQTSGRSPAIPVDLASAAGLQVGGSGATESTATGLAVPEPLVFQNGLRELICHSADTSAVCRLRLEVARHDHDDLASIPPAMDLNR